MITKTLIFIIGFITGVIAMCLTSFVLSAILSADIRKVHTKSYIEKVEKKLKSKKL